MRADKIHTPNMSGSISIFAFNYTWHDPKMHNPYVRILLSWQGIVPGQSAGRAVRGLNTNIGEGAWASTFGRVDSGFLKLDLSPFLPLSLSLSQR